ncbi:MAG: 5, 10-methylenetetrahydrofolate dehydrogenase methenyltetrahydrofolate cyclohydrolase [Firmicutes bacterium]|nr:5, 10-methylenetetrahydrofolate dehydrogenase methenyltetrahydrofolate cyclohydrolase [Bacillota bacterium]
MALILDGKKVAAAEKGSLIAKVAELKEKGQICGLAIVMVGDNPASRIYMNRLDKLAKSIGMESNMYHLPKETSQDELLALLARLNADPSVHGIIPMMPMPAHINPDVVGEAVSAQKDVDAIHPYNVGLFASGKSVWAASTPRAVMAILDYYNIPLAGRHAVVIGRSNVVGKPMTHLLLGRNATVTVCHSKTVNMADILRQADVIVAAVGVPRMVKADMVKPGAVVVDVGINEIEDEIVGDVDYGEVEKVAGAITPVPGGVGSVSTIMVMQAVLRDFEVLHK